MGAVWQVVVSGTKQQQAEAAEILADTRRKLYGLLAEGDEGRGRHERVVPAGHRGPELRIGDAEREAAVTALGEHYAAGRLTKEEYDERADAGLGGPDRTRRSGRCSPTCPVPSRSGRPRRRRARSGPAAAGGPAPAGRRCCWCCSRWSCSRTCRGSVLVGVVLGAVVRTGTSSRPALAAATPHARGWLR